MLKIFPSKKQNGCATDDEREKGWTRKGIRGDIWRKMNIYGSISQPEQHKFIINILVPHIPSHIMCFSRSTLSISPAVLAHQQQSPIFPTSKYFITMMCVLRNIIQLFILYAPLYIFPFTIHSAFIQPFPLLSPDAVQMYCFKLLKYVRTFVLALCILGYHLNHPQHLQHNSINIINQIERKCT